MSGGIHQTGVSKVYSCKLKGGLGNIVLCALYYLYLIVCNTILHKERKKQPQIQGHEKNNKILVSHHPQESKTLPRSHSQDNSRLLCIQKPILQAEPATIVAKKTGKYLLLPKANCRRVRPSHERVHRDRQLRV